MSGLQQIARSLIRTGILLGAAAFLSVSIARAESKKDLEKKKAQIHKDIQVTNKLLNETRKNKSSTLNQLITLNKKISYRNELIGTIHTEISQVDGQISSASRQVDSLESRIRRVKEHYAGLLYFAYKNQGAFSKLSFVFSASSFNQAFQRIQYLKQLSDYRIRQKELMTQLQDSLQGKKVKLAEVRDDKKDLLTAQEREKAILSIEKKEQMSMVNDLSSK